MAVGASLRDVTVTWLPVFVEPEIKGSAGVTEKVVATLLAGATWLLVGVNTRARSRLVMVAGEV